MVGEGGAREVQPSWESRKCRAHGWVCVLSGEGAPLLPLSPPATSP